jgi:predicted nucleic acid-binding protein
VIYVLDASVAVAAVRRSEPGHVASRARLLRLLQGDDEIVVPILFDIEVTSALVRVGVAPTDVATYLATDLVRRKTITLGPRAARAVVGIVHATRLAPPTRPNSGGPPTGESR